MQNLFWLFWIILSTWKLHRRVNVWKQYQDVGISTKSTLCLLMVWCPSGTRPWANTKLMNIHHKYTGQVPITEHSWCQHLPKFIIIAILNPTSNMLPVTALINGSYLLLHYPEQLWHSSLIQYLSPWVTAICQRFDKNSIDCSYYITDYYLCIMNYITYFNILWCQLCHRWWHWSLM